MQEDYTFRCLTAADHDQMYEVFVKAYQDSSLPYTMSQERFIKKYLAKHNLRYDLSVGAFKGDELVGFIFSTVAMYDEKKVAFNSGGGVLKEHRGHDLSKRMYDFIAPKFKEEGVEQVLVEVINTDERVMALSEKLGFNPHKYYSYYMLESSKHLAMHAPYGIAIRILDKPDWELFESFADQNPSFMDSRDHLEHNKYDEITIVGKRGDEVIAYAIFEPDVGRISQIAVKKSHRGLGVAEALLSFIYQMSSNKQLIVNVVSDEKKLKRYFENLGFKKEVDVCEMVKDI